jgi:hypothetical protein
MKTLLTSLLSPPADNYVAVSSRRSWKRPLMVVGAVVVVAALGALCLYSERPAAISLFGYDEHGHWDPTLILAVLSKPKVETGKPGPGPHRLSRAEDEGGWYPEEMLYSVADEGWDYDTAHKTVSDPDWRDWPGLLSLQAN